MAAASRKSAAATRAAGSGKKLDLAELVAAKGKTSSVAAQPTHQHRGDTTARYASLDDLAPNPLNTRMIDFGSESVRETATSMRRVGQLQPCTVVSRMAFVAIFPEFRQTVGDAAYVQVSGGRRRAAVVLLNEEGHFDAEGAAGLDIVVKNDLAASRSRFLTATAEENIERRNYNPIEEARAIEHVVREVGARDDAAAQFGRTPGWVTQRLNLLALAEPVQEAVAAGDIPLREARNLHAVPEDRQLAVLAELRAGARSATTTPDPPSTADQSTEGTSQALPKPASSPPAPRLRATRAAAAIQRLGGTPSKIADSLLGELPHDSVQQLIDELRKRLPKE